MIAFWNGLRAPVRYGIYLALVADLALVVGALNGTSNWKEAGVGAVTSALTLVVGWFAPADAAPVVAAVKAKTK